MDQEKINEDNHNDQVDQGTQELTKPTKATKNNI